ncbi:MAG: PTS glucose transporter subunit IIA [Traorella sp.]
MFNYFKKKKDTNIYSPAEGRCFDISEVDDVGFSSKTMGDGIAVAPTNSVILAPCNGVVTMIFKTGHAMGIMADNGAEILLHIGIDTVNLNGKGFDVNVKVGQKVKKGDCLIKFDLEMITKEYDPTVLMIITNKTEFEFLQIMTS